MIFDIDLLSTVNSYEADFDDLLAVAIEKQDYPTDLFLVYHNAHYDNTFEVNGEIIPIHIGGDEIGLSERTHQDFIDNLIVNLIMPDSFSLENYLLELERLNKNDHDQELKLIRGEIFSIQQEMFIYLKIWGNELFIKRLYGLSRCLKGECYDWFFKIRRYNSDSNTTGWPSEIRSVTNSSIKQFSQRVATLLQDSYVDQVRNAIAHSNYSMWTPSRYVSLLNYLENDTRNSIQSLSFEEWRIIFTNTITIYEQYDRFLQKIKKHYVSLAKQNDNKLQVRCVNTRDNRTTYYNVKYNPDHDSFY